ncbi:hypothetical protein GCM10025771_31190 [Niveibacterium umoris]|uniref:Uncharacterized protein n=1 Tax=Niveibacterium umoris TaxID=1193620 RepID=A0A840BLB7_9RHOO|nr:hypothetical protein [Niveibacterium umoris]MBB4011686.1 hypothetical protein [Niveibacterium umoris]
MREGDKDEFIRIGDACRSWGIGALRWHWRTPVTVPAKARIRVVGGRGFGGRTLCAELRAKGMAADWRDARDSGLGVLGRSAVVLLGRIPEIEFARGVLHTAGIGGARVEMLAQKVCTLEPGRFLGLRGFKGHPVLVTQPRPRQVGPRTRLRAARAR